jgi:putative heme-binding domain-containing protein
MKIVLSAVFVLATANAAFANEGQDIFRRYGCMACHAVGGAGGKVGPALDKIGAKGEAYIREKIVNPSKTPVAGYPANVMPSDYGKRMKPEEIDKLTKWLGALK